MPLLGAGSSTDSATNPSSPAILPPDSPPKYTVQPPPQVPLSVPGTSDPPPPPYEEPELPPYERGIWSRYPGVASTGPAGVGVDSVVILQTAARQQVQSRSPSSTCSSSIIFACAVFWLCGFLFGAIAFIVAVVAHRKLSSRTECNEARKLNRVSFAVSIAGVLTGLLLLIILLSVFVREIPPTEFSTLPTSGLCSTPISTTTTRPDPRMACPFRINGTCFRYVSNMSSVACFSMRGVFMGGSNSTANYTCYFVDCPDYILPGKLCFRYRSTSLGFSDCTNVQGLYIVEVSGRPACYYNNCPGFEASTGDCYKSRLNVTRSGCPQSDYYDFTLGYCFTNSDV